MQYYIVFMNSDHLPCKILKKGFQHCYLLFYDGENWGHLDYKSHMIDFKIYRDIPPSFDLPRWIISKGMHVVKLKNIHYKQRPMPLAVFTCVEAIKRHLGIRSHFVRTPYQLYKYIRKKNSK